MQGNSHTHYRNLIRATGLAVGFTLLLFSAARAQLPPVPYPPENPPSEARRVLGKILFWDEQLSYDNTIACGTCHIPGAGGSDPRQGRHPGTDKGTIDDVHGSPGVIFRDAAGTPATHGVFGNDRQITPRTSPSNFMALWAEEIFWDGRADGRLFDPVSGDLLIESGGGLESQTLAALSNGAEMSHSEHDWQELTTKLRAVQPLALATRVPTDVVLALAWHPDYASLFSAAFGDPEITPARIAFAIAGYQRTLISDRTAWDRLQAGDEHTLSAAALRGWRDFQTFQCVSCHEPPLFTNNAFANIGLRLTRFDEGRMGVTGDPEDAGDMKVPSLRNVALRPRYMHTGQFRNLGAAIGFYLTGAALEDRDDMPTGGVYSFNMGAQAELDVRAFLEEGLTDPRVRAEIFPFDRPILASERGHE
jgi:cytochrome c peroxidase